MKIRLLALIGSAISFALPAFAQQTNTPDQQITQNIRAISKAYDEAVSNNDAAGVAALFTEDAVFVSDRGVIHGRQAIEKWYMDVFQVWHPKNHIGKPDGNAPHIIGTTGVKHGKPENGVRLVEARPATLSQSRAIGQPSIFVTATIERSRC